MRVWIERHKWWLIGAVALALLIVGIVCGWRWALVLAGGTGGTAAGGAAKQLTERQKEREAEGKRLEQERNNLQNEANKTDAMIDRYYQRKGGPRQ